MATGEGTAPAAGGAGAIAGPPAEWRRLDRRSLLVTGAVMSGVAGGVCLPLLLGLASGGWFGDGPGRETALALLVTAGVLLVAGSVAADYANWRRTRYRIGSERVDLHSGLLLLKRRSLARERIRSVDLTAHPLLRLLGLVKVRIGTGESGGAESSLELNPVSRVEGDRIRAELLDRPADPAAAPHGGVLARLDLRWIRYAPTSFLTLAVGSAAFGAVLQVSDWFGVQQELIGWTGDRIRDHPVALVVPVLALGTLVTGAVGALGLWTEMWWGYRLEREPGGVLRVRRGLFTTRSVSVEERRLRGVELVEPIGVRALGGARVDAVATGLAEAESDRQADARGLLPAVPRAVADRVAALVLHEPRSPTSAPLIRHPRRARNRRLSWALAAAGVPAAALAVGGLWLTPVLLYIAAGYAAVALPSGVALALDAYRSLGHGIAGRYLLARSGTFSRRTVALQRTGIIGWTVTESLAQRRAGLITLTATTAAGAGGYAIHDADRGEGLAFADAAVPGLLRPFLTELPGPDIRAIPEAPAEPAAGDNPPGA
ncbi:PH domain-containing protein [Streptomyces qinzhouensis]|uniref:PH domain-containing protein n=1 Tax=Streptomyces qinzhouensis TaxID=2599401 RepID=A0A5B8J6Z1_9ACTN|nr:PH domain-containing protein [Streptomyces qinzhouensis]QDY76204.1 PH domain-containing protein [Streptomyces qinzhouensis]